MAYLAAQKYWPRSPRPTPSPYFNHFSREFFRPYGRVGEEEMIKDETFSKRLNATSCYWLTNPGIALSTMGETLAETAKLLPQYISAVEEGGGLQTFGKVLTDLGPVLGPLNKRSNTTTYKKQKKAAKKLLAALNNDELMGSVRLLALLGVALYVPASIFLWRNSATGIWIGFKKRRCLPRRQEALKPGRRQSRPTPSSFWRKFSRKMKERKEGAERVRCHLPTGSAPPGRKGCKYFFFNLVICI